MSTNRVQKNIKKSNFQASESLPDASYLDFVYNGTNLKISKSDFIAALGVFAELQAAGEATAIDVYNKVGDISYIRSLLGGSGIITSVSPENGVKIDHNFSQDTAGINVVGSIASTSPVFRSILAGTGITVALTGDTIVLNATGIPVASNIVIVNEMSDFPAAESGVITLANDTAYLVSADLTTSDRFVMGNNCVLYGADSSVCSLTYTGTGTMITVTDVDCKVTLITLNAANGKVFDATQTTGQHVFQFVNLTVGECDEIGSIDSILAVQFTDVSVNTFSTSGISFSGTPGFFIGTRNLFISNGADVFDFGTAVFTSGFTLESSVVQFLSELRYQSPE